MSDVKALLIEAAYRLEDYAQDFDAANTLEFVKVLRSAAAETLCTCGVEWEEDTAPFGCWSCGGRAQMFLVSEGQEG